MHRETLLHKQRIDLLFSKVSTLSADLELQSQWSKFLCILLSGFLEVSIQRIYSEYAKNASAPHIARYVNRQLENFQNPKMPKIFELVATFNPDWEKSLKDALDERILDSVNSIVANRHHIAHGRDVGITYVRVKQYYEDAVKLIEALDAQCN